MTRFEHLTGLHKSLLLDFFAPDLAFFGTVTGISLLLVETAEDRLVVRVRLIDSHHNGYWFLDRQTGYLPFRAQRAQRVAERA